MSLAGGVRERRRPYLKATGELHGHSIAHELLIRKTFFCVLPLVMVDLIFVKQRNYERFLRLTMRVFKQSQNGCV